MWREKARLAAERLQRIFDATKGDALIAESLKALTRAAAPAQPAHDSGSRHPREDSSLVEKDPAAEPAAAAKGAAGVGAKPAARVEPAPRQPRAKDSEGQQIPESGSGAHQAGGRLPAAPLAAARAELEAGGKYPPGAEAAEAATEYAAAASQAGKPGALAEMRRAALGVEARETAIAGRGSGQASTPQDRAGNPVEDLVDPAIKALLAEVARMQDKHLNGLRQAVEVIAGTSETVDGLLGLMQTMAARQQQVQDDQSALAQQMAAWARSSLIP